MYATLFCSTSTPAPVPIRLPSLSRSGAPVSWSKNTPNEMNMSNDSRGRHYGVKLFSDTLARAAGGSAFDGGRVPGSAGASSQSVEKLIGRVEDRAEPAGRPVSFDLLFALLPLRCPVPSLIGITLGARPKQNAIVDGFSLQLVAVVQARGKPKFLRQCHPPIDGEPRQHHLITAPVPRLFGR